jgi:hypothetical protein
MVSPWEEFVQGIQALKQEYPDCSIQLEELQRLQDEAYEDSVAELKKLQAQKRAERKPC